MVDTGPEEEGRWIMLNACSLDFAGLSISSVMYASLLAEKIRLRMKKGRLALWMF